MCAIDTYNPPSTAEPHPDPESQHIYDTPYVPKHPPTSEASAGWAQHQRPEDVSHTCHLVVKHVSFSYGLNKKFNIFYNIHRNETNHNC